MAKKTLNESTIRRFQKLANVAPLNEMYMNEEEEELDAGDEAPMSDEELMGDEEPMADAEPMDDMGDGTVEVGEEEIMSAKQGLEDALEVLNQIMPGDMGGDEEGMDADFDAEEAPAPDAEAEDDDMSDELMEALRGISYEPSKKEIVNEVAMRVARRLKTAKLHEAKLNKALGRRK